MLCSVGVMQTENMTLQILWKKFLPSSHLVNTDHGDCQAVFMTCESGKLPVHKWCWTKHHQHRFWTKIDYDKRHLHICSHVPIVMDYSVVWYGIIGMIHIMIIIMYSRADWILFCISIYRHYQQQSSKMYSGEPLFTWSFWRCLQDDSSLVWQSLKQC